MPRYPIYIISKGRWDSRLTVKDENFDGRLEMAKSLQAQHPDVTRITRKWGRWQHQVDYRLFKTNKLKKKADVDLVGINNYGMRLILHNDSR